MRSPVPATATRARARLRALVVATAALLIPGAARSVQGLPELGAGACRGLELASETMECTRDACVLSGEASLRCETMRVWAESIEIAVTPAGAFGGAVASGDVLLVEGNRVVTCERLYLGADRVQAQMNEAVIKVKRGRDRLPGSDIPVGRNQATLTGARVHRLGEQRLRIDDATFTLCDCGDARPSWLFTAHHLEATLGERVTIYWPSFWVAPFGLNLHVPLTPPLPPISLPLKGRAAGFLAPRFTLYEPRWPTLDLPFFVPLGRSWDLTLAPGLRTDWAGEHRLRPSTWGAPRLGARVRYAPLQGTAGAASAQWTYDGDYGAARARARLERAPKSPDACTGPACSLTHRVAVTGEHRTDFSESLRLTAAGAWYSDDNYIDDFEIAATDRAVAYVPSRAQLQARTAAIGASLGAGFFQRTGGTRLPTNLQRGESWVAHHGPALSLGLLPLALGAGVHLEADLGLDRYGPWTDAPRAVSPSMLVAHAAPALALARGLGPVSLVGRAGLDAAWIRLGRPGGGALASTVALVDAHAELPLARRYGTLIHGITPRVGYRAIPWRRGDRLAAVAFDPEPDAVVGSPGGAVSVSAVDERLRRDATSHQAFAGLSQELHRPGGGRVATLDLAQPFDVADGSPLAARGALALAWPGLGEAGVEAGVFIPDLGEGRAALRELLVRVAADLRAARLEASYVRFLPEASRFLRTIYELEAPEGRRVADAREIHYVSGGARLLWAPRVSFAYQTTYRLAARVPREDERPGFVWHRVELGYQSPCDCWGLAVAASMPHDSPADRDHRLGAYELENELRLTFSLNVGGFALGM